MSFDFLQADAVQVARDLLDCELLLTDEKGIARLRIVETEAYHQTDAASHSYKGKTPRTAVMFGPAGFLYVYFTYGMHYCMNVVTGPEGEGSAVLIRAAEPMEGDYILHQNRPGKQSVELTNGPAKLCQALGINTDWSGHDLHKKPLQLVPKSPLPDAKIVQTTRIGISQAQEKPWRFYIRNNAYVSRT
ncbi:MAG TPA: DNA-3-methyladenine glycosylase [Candidatus Saccharimonadales bacterium]|nr:DNA-3-methyladenine glycosylase [Candidatus Saccharimonadales bacterium]